MLNIQASIDRLMHLLVFACAAVVVSGCHKAAPSISAQRSIPRLQSHDPNFDFQEARIESSEGTFYEIAITNQGNAVAIEGITINHGACPVQIMPTIQGQQLSLSLPMNLYSGAQMVVHTTCNPSSIALTTDRGTFRGSR